MVAPQGSHGLDVGSRFAERYVIKEVLGRGGMGAVYRAVDELLGETVALKVSSLSLAPDGRAQLGEEQRREVAMARRVTHPHVARVHDLGVAGSVMFLTMEFIEGRSLWDRRRAGPLSLSEVVVIGRQLTSALAVAHEAGVLHLDLKPQNVMLSEARSLRAVLVDFGIAQALGTRSEGIGTPDYVSPEQLARQPLTGASDVYSLGVMLYELVAGRRAFEGETAKARAMARLLSPPRALGPEVPPTLSELIAAMLSPAAEARPSAPEVERRICSLLDFPRSANAESDGPQPVARPLGPADAPTLTLARARDLGELPNGLGVALAEAYAGLSVVGQERRAVATADAVLAVEPSHDMALAVRALASTREWHLFALKRTDDVAARAVDAVAAALRGASHLAASHVADALVADYSGDIAYASRALKRALALDPTHAFAHEVLGRIEIEGGLGGFERLRLALALDGSRFAALALIARELYFSGDFDGAFNVLDELDRLRPGTNEARTLRCRFALWARDATTAKALRAAFPPGAPSILGAFARMLDAVSGDAPFDEALAYIATLDAVPSSPKRRVFFYQLWAELCGAFGRPEGLRYVVHAAQLPLSDLRWLEACPALDGYRGEPAFKYAHTLVEDRLASALRTG